MLLTLLLLLSSAVFIYFSCEFFVNGIEWLGRRLGLAQTAVGTVLAAFGTALPETVVTLVAVVFGKDAAHKEIGVGAALAGPLVLSTLAYAVVGIVFFLHRKTLSPVFLSPQGSQKLSRDQAWFMGLFVLKVALGLAVFSIKPWLGVLFLLAYGAYVLREIRQKDHEEETSQHVTLEPLKIRPQLGTPSFFWIVLQISMALGVIFVGAQLFVGQLSQLAPMLGISPHIVALLLSPIATELPEIMNAVIWTRQGKQALALSNISGAMMIQATLPTALVLMFTPWLLDNVLMWAAIVTMLSIAGLYGLLRRQALTGGRLVAFGVLYLLIVPLLWQGR